MITCISLWFFFRTFPIAPRFQCVFVGNRYCISIPTSSPNVVVADGNTTAQAKHLCYAAVVIINNTRTCFNFEQRQQKVLQWICSCCVAVKKRTLAARAGTIVRSTNYRHRGLPSRRNGCTCSGLCRYRAVSYPPYRSTQRSSDRMYTHRRTSGLAGDPALRQRWVMLARICTWTPPYLSNLLSCLVSVGNFSSSRAVFY